MVRQCVLLGLNRSSLYYRPAGVDEHDLELMMLLDRQYLETPFYGSRRMTACLMRQGHLVNRKRVRRLMGLMGIAAIYRPPNTSKPWRGHKVYPYLLRGLEVKRVNQVWSSDITYIPMALSFHLVPEVVMARIQTQTGRFYYAKYQFKRSILENALDSNYTTEDHAAALRFFGGCAFCGVLEAPRKDHLVAVFQCGGLFVKTLCLLARNATIQKGKKTIVNGCAIPSQQSL